jgi:hypothetical protein
MEPMATRRRAPFGEGLASTKKRKPPPPVGSKFGGVLAEAEAEERWKHRLLAIAFTIVHGMVYFAMA